MSRERDQTIALAALVQALGLVDELAHNGRCDESSPLPLLNSLFEFNPASTEAVYGRLTVLQPGLDRLRYLLAGNAANQPIHITRYAMSVMILARQLAGDKDRQAIIQSRLQSMPTKVTDENLEVMAKDLARLYQDTLSTCSHRIQVAGAAEHLRDTHVANRIRALLLAAVRAATLWQQTGGRRWRLLVFRKRFASWANILFGESQASRLH